MRVLIFISILCFLISFEKIYCEQDDSMCGIIKPKLKSYIYGGKSTMIEQWPWQVRLFKFFIVIFLVA
jgi:hypothetical protein